MFAKWLLAVGFGFLSSGLALVAVVDEPVIQTATSESLGGAERCLTFISTDKPIYRVGERLYVRGVVLDAQTHKPLADDAMVNGQIEIRGPKGERVAGGYAASQDSVLGFAWDIPDGQPGGPYSVRISYPFEGYAPAERSFDIRSYRAPRLKSQIEFLRDGYGPGDSVTASLHVDRAEGGVPEGAKVTAVARVDGEEAYRGHAVVDGHGNCTVSFGLPGKIARGEGTLALVIEDGGVVETASKTIPILLQTVDVAMYPEGGDLVAGLPTRVYIEARTPADKPADIAGDVIDQNGWTVATFRTEHEGRGRFAFTPQADGRYVLRISEPAGIKTEYPLPQVKAAGAVVRAVDEVVGAGEPVRLRVGGTESQPLTIVLSRREDVLVRATVMPPSGSLAEVVLSPPASADGVLIATVYGPDGAPLAERLVFRKPAHAIQVAIQADHDQYTPGDAASLTITTTDASGAPIGAVVCVTVTDDSVLEMIEKREQAPRLPVLVLLEPEARELADAHVYLDDANPDAPLAVDLLLGTQGWRRFAFQHAKEFIAAHEDAARRVLAFRNPQTARYRFMGGGLGGEVLGKEVLLGMPVDAAAAPPNGDEIRADTPQPVALPESDVSDEKEVERGRGRRAGVESDKDAQLRDVEAGQVIALDQERKQVAGLEVHAKLVGRELVADELRIMPNGMIAVREYAHELRTGRQPDDRFDFTETLYWHSGIRTDAETGQAKVRFALNDSVTAFRVFADAFDANGRLGDAQSSIESVEPFYIEPKLPLEVTAGDRLRVPVGVVSNVHSDDASAMLTVEAGDGFEVGPVSPVTLASGDRGRGMVDIAVGAGNGPATITLHGRAGAYADSVTRSLVVKPLGFPVELAHGGLLAANGSATCKIEIPSQVVPGSVTARIAVYPTPLANLTSALERLIQEPNGCFEQTSSTSYPLVMAQQYFLSHTGIDPSLIERSRDKLEKGYARLASFECSNKGYEWFGEDPGHEALTAYGLMQFCDMGKVRNVDSAMVDRTRRWLLETRDGEGGFKRGRRALHTWIEDRNCSNGYILWSLLESDEGGLDSEIAAFKSAAEQDGNSYVAALAANVMALAGDEAAAKKFTDRLVAKQNSDGVVDGATTSIVGSGGEALNIETTALAVLAWLRDPAYAAAVEKGVHYLFESCKAGRYGSTQSTVLALRAIVAYDKSKARPKAPGSISVLVDGSPVGGAVAFDGTTQNQIAGPDVAELLTPGTHSISLRMDDGSEMPYAVTVNYFDRVPASSEECKVELTVALANKDVAEGEITEAMVTVTNRTDEAIPTPVAIIGLPGGLEPRHDQLKELVKSKRIDAYEVIGREVVLYWRGMSANQSVDVPLSLIAAIPGTYTGPASRAYLYYTDEFKTWAEPLKVEITPRGDGA